MTRIRLLIALITGLAVALTLVVVDIATGFVTGGTSTAVTATAPGAGAEEGTGEPAPEFAEPPTGRYVGTSDDGGFTVAVIMWDTDVVAYVTDGQSNAAWLTGVYEGDGTLSLSGDGEAGLTASYDQGSFIGTAYRGGWVVRFSVPEVQAPAGIYRASGETNNGVPVAFGLIVLPDESQTGLEWVDGEPGAAPAWDLSEASIDHEGTAFQVKPVQPGDV